MSATPKESKESQSLIHQVIYSVGFLKAKFRIIKPGSLNPLFIRSSIPLETLHPIDENFNLQSQSLIHQVIYSVGNHASD